MVAKILVLDSNSETADLLQEDLRQLGYFVSTYDKGIGASEKINNAGYQLIVIERNLIDMDGLRLCQQLRKEGLSTNTKLILISSWNDGSEVNIARQLGIDAMIHKPFIYEDFAECVQRLLEPNQRSKD